MGISASEDMNMVAQVKVCVKDIASAVQNVLIVRNLNLNYTLPQYCWMEYLLTYN